jgi:Gas vesicle synthesis protein GvpL/GvpF
MSEKATYVYCLVSANRRPTLAGAPRGLAGTGPVRLIDVDRGLWLVVADAPLKRYGADAINPRLSDLDWVSRLAVDHETVIEWFIKSNAVLPMKLFTLFSNDARAVEHIAAERRRIDALLKRVAKRVEWGVRIVLGRQKASEREAKPRRVSDGMSYLAHKKAQRDAASELAKRARVVVTDVYDQLSEQAALARRRPASELPVQGGPLLLDAAFLVPQSKSAQFRTFATRHARALMRSGYVVTVSGPWPPYSFIQE